MLYSCAVYIKAVEDIRFYTYEGEALHGLLFNILSKVDAKMATKVHDSFDKKFTISNFMPFTQRRGKGKILKNNKEYKFRITFLDQDLYRNFIRYFLTFEDDLLLNGVKIIPQKILTTDERDSWCRETNFDQLLKSPPKRMVNIRFLTTTSFRLGERNIILPIPESVFGSLLYKWEAANGPELSLESSDLADIDLNRYDIKSRLERFKSYVIKGFTGNCQFRLENLDKEKRREVLALARFGFYSGIGYKTTMGLGQVKIG